MANMADDTAKQQQFWIWIVAFVILLIFLYFYRPFETYLVAHIPFIHFNNIVFWFACVVGIAAYAFAHWQSFRSEMDRLFDRFAGGFGFGLPSFRRLFDVEPGSGYESSFSFSAPAIDVTEDDKAYKITAELPGLAQSRQQVLERMRRAAPAGASASAHRRAPPPVSAWRQDEAEPCRSSSMNSRSFPGRLRKPRRRRRRPHPRYRR